MMEDIDLEVLKEAGLTEYESKAYICLLKYGAQKGGEVADHSKIPKTRVYDMLRSLNDKGLASMIQEKPMKFSPIDPEVGLKSLYENKISQLKSDEERAVNSLKNVEKRVERGTIEEKVDVLLGFDKMYSHWIEKCKQAEGELLAFSVGEQIPNNMKITLRRLVERGIDARFIASKCDEENKSILKKFQERIGWDMRYYDTTEEFIFAIVDREISLINVRKPGEKEERITIIFEIPSLAEALAEYFETMWEKGEEIQF